MFTLAESSSTTFLHRQNCWLKNTKNCNIRILHNFRYTHKSHSDWPTCTRYATRLLYVPLRNCLAQDRCQHHVCWICNRWCWLFRDFRWNHLHEKWALYACQIFVQTIKVFYHLLKCFGMLQTSWKLNLRIATIFAEYFWNNWIGESA